MFHSRREGKYKNNHINKLTISLVPYPPPKKVTITIVLVIFEKKEKIGYENRHYRHIRKQSRAKLYKAGLVLSRIKYHCNL